MAQPYFDQLQTLISAQEDLPAGLACKHFFSGAAVYLDENICASLSPMGLAFKLPQERCEDLIAKGLAERLRYFENSPVKKGYVLFPELKELSDTERTSYFGECLAYASVLDV